MKIIHIAVQHPPRDGRIYHKECVSLAQQNEIHLLTAGTDAAHDDPVTFHAAASYPEYDGSLAAWLVRYFRCCLANLQKALRLRGDAYHIHETPLIPLAVVLKLFGKKVVYDVHEDAPRQAVSIGRSTDRPWLGYAYAGVCRLYETAARWLFDGFVAATPEIGRRFPRKRTAVVQNFALPSEMEALGGGLKTSPYPSRPAQVVYLGGLTRIRGIREVIEAMERVDPRSGARLTLAGPFDSSSFQDECRNLEGWQQVDYLGVLGRQGIMDALSKSRIGLVTMHPVPNYIESWPVKLFEYMAAGLPVIASDFPEWRQRFGQFDCIRFVDPLKPQAIATEIEYLLEHQCEAEAMGRRGKAAVAEHFNWQTEAEKLFQLYDRVGGLPNHSR